MRAFFFVTVAVVLAAQSGASSSALAAEYYAQTGAPIVSEAEQAAPDAGISVSLQDFGGGVGADVAAGGGGGGMTIQMAQPSAGSGYAPGNGGSNVGSYVRPTFSSSGGK